MFLAVDKLTDVSVLVGVLEVSNPIGKILLELSYIDTTVSVYDFTVTLLCPMFELSLVDVAEDIDEHSFTMPPPLTPFPLIFLLFLWNFIRPVAML